MEFTVFKEAIDDQFIQMSVQHSLFVADATRDELWDTYISSFPEGTNPIYKERTENDCQCCKSFIRKLGKVVAIIDNKLVSIWDIDIGGHYQVVADAMSALVKSKAVVRPFLHYEPTVGVDSNKQMLEDETIITWEHFYCKLPAAVVVTNKDKIGPRISKAVSNFQVLQRSLDEITLGAAETVLELIEQGSLYRGEEHKNIVELFIIAKQEYDEVLLAERVNYCWELSQGSIGNVKIRNTVIGTLMSDLSVEVPLDDAVRMFESKVAPANYKRPKALITKKMIALAQGKVVELGLEDSLPRRYAVAEDLTINNVLFANRDAKAAMDVFEEMAEEAAINPKSFDKVEEVGIDKFIKDILPKATGVELLFENKHAGNLVSLIAPVNEDAEPMFKWKSAFSWAYVGEVADSIKERVKRAGGDVEGVVNIRLAWSNSDDLDVSVKEPGGNRIYYGSEHNPSTSGRLDVDMNAGGPSSRTEPVENITYTDREKIKEGTYIVEVHNYTLRGSKDVGFDVEIEHDGNITSFHHARGLRNNERIEVATFTYTDKGGIKFLTTIPSTQASKEVWSISTSNFRKVSMIMHSPNHWDGEETGNKHWFFMMEGCKNEESARGFFNEFLRNDLTENRKVFEVLGAKMKAPPADNQLSGLGFSSTQRNQVTARITGTFNRTIKINF